MARLSPTRFPPGFFDLPADAGHSLPLEVIAAWIRSPQTPEAARLLLEPCTLRGILVTSDTAGLTRLTRERSLIEILSLVSRPKELVHAYGRAIGGTAVGVWAADNSTMFYPQGVAPDHVAAMLLALLDRIRADCEVGIGIAAHAGAFYELGGGLYGMDAERVENIAEDHTEAGELVVTDELRILLGDTASFELAPRLDLAAQFGVAYRVVDGPRLRGIEPAEFRYPIPFPEETYDGLTQFQRSRRTSVVPRPAYRDGAVVVVDREREDRDLPEVATLNDLALAAAITRVAGALLEETGGMEVKSAGGAGIYFFEDPRRALAFSRKLREFFTTQRVRLAIGIDVGRVLVFDLGPGQHDAAGSPVNVASKLAQDAGRLDAISLTRDSARQAGLADVVAAEAVTTGGLTLEIVRL